MSHVEHMDLNPSRRRARGARGLLLAAVVASAAFGQGCSCSEPDPAVDAGMLPVDAAVVDPPDSGTEPCVGDDCNPRPDAGTPDAEVFTVTVRSVVPSRGPIAGGAAVTLEGGSFYRGFAAGSTAAKKDTHILFGANEASDFRIIDDDTLEVTAPPNPSGAVDVIVRNPNGTATCAGCFTYFVELSLASLAPTRGPLAGGLELELKGQGFSRELTVIIGGRASPKVTWVDEQTARALVPPGAAAGPVDVRVFDKNGVGEIRRGFTYVAPVVLTAVEPAYGPVSGGTPVVLRGAGLGGAQAVTFGTAAATFAVRDAQTLEATAPAGGAGPVDVTVTGAQGSATLRGGFVYFDGQQSGLAIAGVSPAHGPREGGGRALIVGSGLSATSGALIGGSPARVIGSVGPNALEIEPPPGVAGTRVDVAVSNGSSQVTLAQAYRYDLAADSLSPSSGSAAGGETITISGEGYPSPVEVLVGGLPASDVTVVDARTVTAKTPPGSGGLADVVVRDASDPSNADVLPGAFGFVEPLKIGRISPDTGAIAGGTYVTVLGAAFEPGVTVLVGGSPVKDLQVVDRNTLTGRTPPGVVGAVDVKVVKGAAEDVASGAFTYFDPKNGGGGSSGGPLNGTLNVTVLESSYLSYGDPVPGATVMLGTDPTTPLQGKTDRRGQLTLSDPSLVKAQQVTVSKPGYLTMTVARQESQNLTLYLSATQMGSGEPGFPPSSAPAIISGRVTGFKLPRPLRSGEVAWAEVWTASSSVYGTPPLGWRVDAATRDARGERWRITEDGGTYSVFSGKGMRALYAVFGIHDRATDTFTPVLMGVRRSITADPDKPAIGQDIVLDMHLDATVPVTISNPQWDPLQRTAARNEVYAWLELGGQGVVPLGSKAANSDRLTLTNLPRVDGANLVFLNHSSAGNGYPETYSFRRQYGDVTQGVTIGPMLGFIQLGTPSAGQKFNGQLAWSFGTGPLPDLTQISLTHVSLSGWNTVWSAILPGTELSVTMPQNLSDSLKAKLESSDQLLVDVTAVRSPRFEYSHWTYGQLSLDAWTAWTQTGGPLEFQPAGEQP